MPRARNHPKQLRQRNRKVNQLRDKEQHQRLRKVPRNRHHRKRDPREVRITVPNKDLAWIPIEFVQRETARNKGQTKNQRNEVWPPVSSVQLQCVVDQNGYSNDNALSHFETCKK